MTCDPWITVADYNVSLLRLKSQVKELRENPDMFERHDAIISQQVQNGIIEPADNIDYLPHQALVRENVESTKVRVVYDTL